LRFFSGWCNWTLKHYSLSSDFEGGNQLEMYKMIKDGVTGLLSEGRFLRGGFDENVGLFFSLQSLFKSPMISLG
jgi:hypothetical protein